MEKKQISWSLPRVTLLAMTRRLGASILLASVVIAGCVTSVLLDRLIQRQEESLQRMIEITRINCIVTDAQGMHSDDLNMLAGFVDMLMGYRHDRGCYLDEYVMDVNAKSTVPLKTPSETNLCRILSFASDSSLSEITGNHIALNEGWTEDTFLGSEKVCIITEDVPTFTDMSGTKWVQVTQNDSSSADLQVIGRIQGQLEGTVYCPFYLNMHEDLTELYRVESCSFTIRDNHFLDNSKAAIYEKFVEPSLSNPLESQTYGVIVQDETYLKALEEIQSNLTMLRLLPPILILLTGCIGFFASYMTIRSRKKEFAISRCLGITQRKIFTLVIMEQIVLAVLGGMAGIVSGSLASGSGIILADEPTGNLDSTNSRNIVEILLRLAHENDRCVIIVTHDPAVAEAADVILKMKDGRLITDSVMFP